MKINGQEIKFDKFPAGETNFKILIFEKCERYNRVMLITSEGEFEISSDYWISTNTIFINNVELYTNNDIINFVLLMRTIRDHSCNTTRVMINVSFNYLPYMRQDRICNHGEPFSLKYIVDVIKLSGVDTYKILDPHSNVTTTLLDAEVGYTRMGCAKEFYKLVKDTPTLVIPDLGAIKRSEDFYSRHKDYLNGTITFHKKRDLSNGNIISLKVVDVCDSINEKVFLIYDDICDGGATFLAIGSKLKEIYGDDVELRLFVTHGLFTKGMDELNKMFKVVQAVHYKD